MRPRVRPGRSGIPAMMIRPTVWRPGQARLLAKAGGVKGRVGRLPDAPGCAGSFSQGAMEAAEAENIVAFYTCVQRVQGPAGFLTDLQFLSQALMVRQHLGEVQLYKASLDTGSPRFSPPVFLKEWFVWTWAGKFSFIFISLIIR